MSSNSGATTARRNKAVLYALADIEDLSDEQDEDEPITQEEDRKESCADTLLRIGLEADLIRTPLGELYARVPVNGHYEIQSVREKGAGFRHWLTARYFDQTHHTPNANALARVMDLFTAWAVEAPTKDVHARIAEHEGAIYLDLADDEWRVVKITAQGWEVVSDYPVHFRRARGTLPIPVPEYGGSLSELKAFFNVATEDDWKMVIGWLLDVFHPDGPYAILAISGEQGTAKTSATRFLRQLVDPNIAALRDAPKEIRDLVIAAKNGRVLALDNLSGMPQWLSDALCRMATGSGFGTRALYTDDEETLFNNRRPIVFNGIEELATKPDLGDRCIVLTLQEIDSKQRKTERELNKAWDVARPRILGALLDAVCGALAGQENVRGAEYPRMADFAEWVTAAENQLGWKRGSFVAALDRNRASAIQTELEASPVADAVTRLTEESRYWKGTPTEFYTALSNLTDPQTKMSLEWPKTVAKIGGKLRRLAQALRARGITVTFGSSHGQRYVEVNRSAGDGRVTVNGSRVTVGDGTDPTLPSPEKVSIEANNDQNMASGDGSDGKVPTLSLLTTTEEERDESREERPGKVPSLPSPASPTLGACSEDDTLFTEGYLMLGDGDAA